MTILAALARLVRRACAPEFAALQSRLDELEAKEAIRDLFQLYAFTADTGDSRGWSELWTEDCVFEPLGYVRQGRAQMYAANSDPDGIHKKDIEGKGSLHATGPVMIRVDGDKAWAEGSSIVWIKDGDAYRQFTMTYGHWDLERQNGRWLIKHRKTRPVSPGRAADVWTAWRDA
jgi:hypothetical protein